MIIFNFIALSGAEQAKILVMVLFSIVLFVIIPYFRKSEDNKESTSKLEKEINSKETIRTDGYYLSRYVAKNNFNINQELYFFLFFTKNGFAGLMEIEDIEEFIGVDFGLTDIAVTSDGAKHSAEWLNQYREKRQNIRSSLQRKGTRGARRLLKRLKGKEKTTATIINHTISKSIVESAKSQGKGIAIEDLTGIRFTSKRRSKKFRIKLGRWGFHQLRCFLEYKSKLNGVKLIVVDPAYTSKTCSCCRHIGKRNNKSFKCENCGNDIDSDVNASINIATLGAVISQPEKSEMYSCAVHF